MSVDTQVRSEESQRTLRQALSMFPTGVVAVSALRDGSPVGLSMNSFSSVSLEPALVSVCIAKTSKTWPLLHGIPRLGVSVLSSEQGALCRRLSSKTGERFESGEWHARDSGAVLINDATLWLECSVYSTVEAGDHDVVLLSVHDSELFPEIEPLVFHQSTFRELQLG